ncbi:MAG: hypothetical protein WC455_14020 [Dehalococcoidia bacterium]|jgi:hypothetical protein
MKFTIAREKEFVPTVNGNDKEETPVKFILKYLNSVEREGILNSTFDEEGRVRIKPDYRKACLTSIKKINDFVVDNKPIETAKDFLELPGFYEMFLEVASEIISMNAVQDSKNLQ